MTRILMLILSVLTIGLASCNNHDETPYETNLPIRDAYLPVDKTFSTTDKNLLDQCKEHNFKVYTVNSREELPEDIFGFSSAYDNINFKENTLLITYRLHSWKIETYDNRWYRNNVEKSYNWAISLGITGVSEEIPEEVTFTRFAILVPKHEPDTEITVWYSLGDLEWEWD